MVLGSEANEAHVWQTLITEFLVFGLVSFNSAARHGVLISNTADSPIVADDWGVSVPIPDRLPCLITDLSFLPSTCKTYLDSFLAYVAFFRGQEVYSSCFDVEDHSLLYLWRTGEVIGLSDQCVHERKREVDGRVFNQKYWLRSSAVRFKVDDWLRSLDDAVAEARETLSDERPDSSPGCVLCGFQLVLATTTGLRTSEKCLCVRFLGMKNFVWN